jgi:hypothetical protein
VDIVRLEGLGQLKISKILSGIEPATFRFVACLNQLYYSAYLNNNNNNNNNNNGSTR